MKCLLLTCIFLISQYLQAQNFSSSVLVSQDTNFTIQLGGLLDGKNCQIPNKYLLIGYVDHQRIPAIEPMDSVVFENIGNTDIQKFQIIAKENNIYSIDSIAKQAISSVVQSSQDSLYSIYRYMIDKHFYFYVPEPESREMKEVTRHFGIYGYGHCGSIANCVTLIARRNQTLNQRYWVINGNSHAISELYFNGKYYFVDADEEMLMKGRNNKDYISFGEAYEDLFLFYRTTSFGACESYSFANSVNISGYRYNQNTDHYAIASYEDSPPCYPNDTIGNEGPELFYTLKSGEKLVLSANRDSSFDMHHYPYDVCFASPYGYLPDSSTVLSVIYNARSSYDLMATNSLSDKFVTQTNSVFDFADHHIKAVTPGIPSSFTIQKLNQFPIVNGRIKLQANLASINDAVLIEISFDNVNWIPVQTLTLANNPNEIYLSNIIQPKGSYSKYNIYIRVSFTAASISDVVISDFTLDLNLQMSRFLYPSLFLGDNRIQLKIDSNINNQLSCSFYWKEDASNTPPSPPNYPTFPSNNSIINVTNFPFTWAQIHTDAEGDSIVEWQFQLSEYPDFRTVVANNFDHYSFGNENAQASFFSYVDTVIGKNTFFNDNANYYWHVRVRDQRNAWSTWSNVWQFKVRTTMPIQNLRFELLPSDTNKLQLTWNKNVIDSFANQYLIINNDGATSLYLHPWQVTSLYTNTASLIITPDTINFSYRGFAMDAQQNISAPSPIVLLPKRLDLDVHQAISFTQIMDSLQHPFPNYPSLQRNYFLVFDTLYFQMNNPNELTAIKEGRSMVSICYMADDDTVYKMQFICQLTDQTPVFVQDIVFSNPATGQFYLQNSKGVKKQIFNTVGQLVHTSFDEYIHIENMPKGLYILRMKGMVKKFVLR